MPGIAAIVLLRRNGKRSGIRVFNEPREVLATKFRKFGGAFVLASMVATGILTTTTPAYAGPPQGTICRLLFKALAAANVLPASEYKTALVNYINSELTEYGCQ